MNLDPKLSGIERIVAAVIGAGFVAFGALGGLDQTLARIVVIGLGVALVIGGIGGT